jgi:hypothetical protein
MSRDNPHYENYDSFDDYQEHVASDYSVDLWAQLPGTEYLNDAETESAFYFLNEGWLRDDNTADDRMLAREYFFEYMNMVEEDFDWEAWEDMVYG